MKYDHNNQPYIKMGYVRVTAFKGTGSGTPGIMIQATQGPGYRGLIGPIISIPNLLTAMKVIGGFVIIILCALKSK